jgi:hypothetical protein
MNNHHQQEENAAAGALAERMVNVLTLHDNDDKKKEEDEDTKNADKDKKKKPVANDANDISLVDDASPLNLDQSTTTSTLSVRRTMPKPSTTPKPRIKRFLLVSPALN